MAFFLYILECNFSLLFKTVDDESLRYSPVTEKIEEKY